MDINFRNPFVWIFILFAALSLTMRIMGVVTEVSPATLVLLFIGGIACGIAMRGYDENGWDGVVSIFRRTWDSFMGKW